MADRYAKLAQTILRALSPPLQTIKCHFFCGVYEMYSVQLVAALLHLNQASLQLKMHLAPCAGVIIRAG